LIFAKIVPSVHRRLTPTGPCYRAWGLGGLQGAYGRGINRLARGAADRDGSGAEPSGADQPHGADAARRPLATSCGRSRLQRSVRSDLRSRARALTTAPALSQRPVG